MDRCLCEGSRGQNVRESGCSFKILSSRTPGHTLSLAACHGCTEALRGAATHHLGPRIMLDFKTPNDILSMHSRCTFISQRRSKAQNCGIGFSTLTAHRHNAQATVLYWGEACVRLYVCRDYVEWVERWRKPVQKTPPAWCQVILRLASTILLWLISLLVKHPPRGDSIAETIL